MPDRWAAEPPSSAGAGDAGQRSVAREIGAVIPTMSVLAAPHALRSQAVQRSLLPLRSTLGNRALARVLTAPPQRVLAREPPPRDTHKGSTLKQIKGKAFVNGVSPEDVKQGALGDCNLLAPAAAVAFAGPSKIRSLITDNGDDTYNVTLYYRDHFWTDLTAHVFTVTSSFYVDDDGNPLYAKAGDTGPDGPELWVMLIEKAFAKYKGSYEVAGGAMWDKEGLELLTGNDAKETNPRDWQPDLALGFIKGALDAGEAVTACTSTNRWDKWWRTDEEKKEIEANKIVLDHAYAITDVDKDARTIKLRNPWGYQHIDALPFSVFRKYFYSWSQVSVK
jgi:hypothetical protein